MVKGSCTLHCHVGLPLKGKTKQDKIQDVQSQNMESRGAITKVKSAWRKERSPRRIPSKKGIAPSDLFKDVMHQVKQISK